MLRWARLLMPLVVVGAACASVVPAAAATDISPPTISASGGIGPYTAGTPATFTFTETGVGTPVAYEYTVNGGAMQTVQAPSGTASAEIVPARQHNRLFAYAVAADGTVSGGAVYDFYAVAATPAADKDLNGDGLPDLLTVGNTAGLAPGLWLATGQPAAGGSAGLVTVPATDIGINGVLSSPGSPADFNGAQAITGRFFGYGFQDVLLYYPSGNDAGGGAIVAGQGDGSALWPFSGSECNISSGILTDFNGDNPLQLANAYASIYGTGLPDLIATSGDPANGYYLDYYYTGAPCLYNQAFAVSTPTPDGTADWNKWTLATLPGHDGAGMFLWNESTGTLYLWTGVKATDNGDGTGHLSYTQYLISPHWHRGVSLTTLEAAYLNGDGVPDLWTVDTAGTARAYLISGLSATGPAEIEPQEPQPLS